MPGFFSPVKPTYPGVKGIARKKIKINDEKTIPKDARIIIEPLAENRYKLTTYEEVKPDNDLLESEGTIRTFERFIFQTDKPKKYFWFQEHYKRSNQSLFGANGPFLEDIQQYKKSNCFLLAAIQAILNHPGGPGFIQSLFTENPDETVTVRLYNREEGKFKEQRVQRAFLVDEYGYPLNKHSTLWPHILEDAFVVHSGSNGSVDSSSASVFNDGGRPEIALEILTGLKEQRQISLIDTTTLIFLFSEDEITQIKGILELANAEQLFVGILDEKLEAIKATLEPKYPNFIQQYMEYFNYYINNQKKCEEAFIQGSVISIAEEMLESNHLEAAMLLTEIHNYLRVPTANNTVHGNVPPLSGFSTTTQRITYETMVQALQKGQLITATSLGKQTEVGIASPHAYTVLNVYERDNQLYVQLRNPWGHTGRSYQERENENPVPVETKEAIFDLKLADFFTLFTSISLSYPATELFNHVLLKRELMQLVSNFQINIDINLEDLIECTKIYSNYKKKLLELEQIYFASIEPEIKEKIQSYFDSGNFSQDGILALLKTSSIVQIFKPANPLFFTRLYFLTQLNWLKNQNPLDTKTIAELEDKIIANADYEFCKTMATNNEVMNFIIDINVKATEQLLKEIENHCNSLSIKCVSIQTCKNKKLAGIAEEIEQLEEKLINLYTFKSLLKHFGIDYDQKIAGLMQQKEFIKQSFAQLPKLEAAHQDKDKTNNVLNDIKVNPQLAHLVHFIEEYNLSELPPSLDRNAQQNNKKITKLEEIFLSIKALLNSIISAIKNLFAFKPNNSYFLAADHTESIQFSTP